MWNSGPMPSGPGDNRPGHGLLARLAARLRGHGDGLTALDRAHTAPDGSRIPLSDDGGPAYRWPPTVWVDQDEPRLNRPRW